MEIAVAVAVDSVAIAVYRKIAADGRGNCCGLTSAEIAVAIATDFRELPWLVPRSLPRTEPRHVPWPQPWHLPWKRHEPLALAVETRGFPRYPVATPTEAHGSAALVAADLHQKVK